MKVGLVYIIGFDGSGDEETQAARDGLRAKYMAKGLESKHIVTVFIQQQTVYYQLLNKSGHLDARKIQNASTSIGKVVEYKNGVGDGPFATLNADHPRSAIGNGVGVYFLFHGTAGNADIGANVTAYITKLLMSKHPNGLLRKVLFVVCAFASANAGKSRTSEMLGKFATSLLNGTSAELKPHLPKLAGFTNGVYVNGQGHKFSDKENQKSMKASRDQKIAYVLEGQQYVRKILAESDAWSDPEVTTAKTGENIVTVNPTQ